MWNQNNYPNSMKNLDEKTRNKAIDIANALLEDGYEEGRAIPIAISQAKKWAGKSDDAESRDDLHVVPHPDGWAVRRENSKRASVVLETKEDARNRALEIAKNENLDVIMHDNNGRIKSYVDVVEEVDVEEA